MSKLNSINAADVRTLLGNACYARGILAIGTTKSGFNTTAALAFTVNGIAYAKAAMTSNAMTVTHTNDGKTVGGGYIQPVLTTVYYTLGVNAAGTICVVQGTYSGQMLTDQMGTSYVGTGNVPDVPSGYTAFGLIKVALASTATFTPNTTLFDASNVTATFYDIAVLPATNP